MKTDAIAYHWPPFETDDGKPAPKDARLILGTLVVPPDLPPFVLAYMEERYRRDLWPPCRIDGYQRYARQFAWTDSGHVLHYRIVDVPIGKKTSSPT